MTCDNVQVLSTTEHCVCNYYWASAGSNAILIFHFPFNSTLLQTKVEQMDQYK
jgi:hypothetical protein